MSFKVGIDVGGTFTDLFLWAEEGAGGSGSFKVLSTPQDPSLAVIEGLRTMAEARGLPVADFARATSLIVHGTTVTTNAVLTRGGAPTALLTTEGVRDALEMRRGIREKQYDNRFENVVPLVPRRLRRPVAGRLDYRGAETQPLDLAAVHSAALELQRAGVTSVAVCFLHSYANPDHERAAADKLRALLPGVFVSVSSEVLPVIRFYDRVSTTVLNAYVGPVLSSYLDGLISKLAEVGFAGVLLIMQSNGGLAVPAITQRLPASTLLSGPAGGPRAAAVFAAAQQHDDCLLVDMGGTSFDASLVRDGAAALRHDGQIDRLRIALPMLDIVTIGAGGGSLGWIDEGGLLRMGPASAGALPGPACYGRGGERPACTDADLLLGYLDPQTFAGGRLKLDAAAARRAVETHIARPLSLGLEEAAAGMYRVINTNMANGVREITVKRGLDPREFPLVVAGGAGPLHACMIAAELQIPTIIVPAAASTLCATGMLLSDLQHDFVRSCVGPLAGFEPRYLHEMVGALAAEGERQLREEGARSVEHRVALDLRYLKQYHEVTLPVPRGLFDGDDWEGVARAFHAEHDRLYGYHLEAEGTGLELINVRVRCVGHAGRVELPRVVRGGEHAKHARTGTRRAFVPETAEFAELPVYDGRRLLADNRVEGPALVERPDTTIFVSAAYAGEVDEAGSLVLRARGGRS